VRRLSNERMAMGESWKVLEGGILKKIGIDINF
jgi:hypothetical protein